MHTTLAIVLPVFGLILCGYLVGRTRLLSIDGIKGLTNFVFYIAMPALLFRSLATLARPEGVDFSIVFAYFGSCLVVFGGGVLIGRYVFRNSVEEQAMLGMSATFSNSILLGIPLALAAFGDAALLPTMLIIGFHSLVLIGLPTIVIESHRSRGGRWHQVIRSTLSALVRNPIVVAMVLGVVFDSLGLILPDPVDRFLELLGRAGPPTALFTVGAALTAYKIGGDLREVSVAMVLKLVCLPALVWLGATYLFAVEPAWAAVATVIAATPIGVNVFVFANTYETYVARAAAGVLLSTAIAWLTVAALLAILIGN
ncbi:MAG: AEC family transporter [Alphaproteobacteria bacterium]|nr:AEC family transporter [Alphaproteobacteria bacterium]